MTNKTTRLALRWFRSERPTPYDKHTTRQVRRKARKCPLARTELWYRGKEKRWGYRKDLK